MNYRFPFYSFEPLLNAFYRHFVFKKKFKRFGSGNFVSPFSEFLNMQTIEIGNHVVIQHGAWIMGLTEHAGINYSPEIVIDDDTYIGHYFTLSAIDSIKIGKEVTIGDNVYVADSAHSYGSIEKSIMQQELNPGGKTIIHDRCWIGKNVVISGNLEIGKNAIIGANSFVNKSVPPYTVVAGNPAVPIKIYDFKKMKWIPVKNKPRK